MCACLRIHVARVQNTYVLFCTHHHYPSFCMAEWRMHGPAHCHGNMVLQAVQASKSYGFLIAYLMFFVESTLREVHHPRARARLPAWYHFNRMHTPARITLFQIFGNSSHSVYAASDSAIKLRPQSPPGHCHCHFI
jgi:hypothetical protein